MDENIGVYNKNKDNVMILPISVDQKNTKLGALKLNRQLSQLDLLLDIKDVKQGETNGIPVDGATVDGADFKHNNLAEDDSTDSKQNIVQSSVVEDIEMNDIQPTTNKEDKDESISLQDTTMNTPGVVNDSFPMALDSLNIEDANTTQNDKEDDNDDLFEDII
jgi:mediator of RNA polymerase II transcription subunit 11